MSSTMRCSTCVLVLAILASAVAAPAQTKEAPSFEVASIRPSPDGAPAPGAGGVQIARTGLKLTRIPDDAPSDAPFTVTSSGGPDGVTVDLGQGASLVFNNKQFQAKKVTMQSSPRRSGDSWTDRFSI